MYVSLDLLTPPEGEPVELDQVRRHLRVDNTDDDALLTTYLATARDLAQDYLGRALVSQQLRFTISNTAPGLQWPMAPTPLILPMWLPYAAVFNQPIQLPRSPVLSVDRVARSVAGQLQDEELPAARYSTDIATTPARVLLSASAQPQQGQHVTIDFKAGYPSPEAIPPKITQALLLGTAWLYEHRGDDEAADLPAAFYNLLTPNRLVTFG